MPISLLAGIQEPNQLAGILNNLINAINAVSEFSGPLELGGTLKVDGTVTVGNIIRSTTGQHLALNSGATANDQAGKNVRINSITNSGTANSWVGVQIKPGQGASMANGVTGIEISPRLENAIALSGSGTITGAHVDTYLKGTTGNIAGDVRALNLELVTDDAGARAITGNVSHIRIRSAWSGTIGGKFSAMRIEVPETQTNSKNFDCVLEFVGTNPLIWAKDPGTEPSTAAGYFKVRVDGADRWVQLYSGAPVT